MKETNVLRKLLSRVEEVFELAGRGCVVAPGIPRSSDARLPVGTRVWLTRPDGSAISSQIRGIEVGTQNPHADFALLFDEEITAADVPPGTLVSYEIAPAGALLIQAKSANGVLRLETLFPVDENGRIRFGHTAATRRGGLTLRDLQSRDMEFIDYIMEGFVPYHLNLRVREDVVILKVSLHGSNRDQYIEPQIRSYFHNGGLSVTSIERCATTFDGAADIAHT